MATRDATVCIPWRPQPDRLAAHERVLNFWMHHGFKIVEADSDRAHVKPDAKLPFNLSQARNYAVDKARTRHVIVSDADTIPDIASVIASLDEFDGVTWPYQWYRHIPGEYADKPDLMTAPIDRNYTASVGGIFICKRETYWGLGGCDERFTGWGYEDNAFHLVAQCLSKVRRMPGTVFSFNHDGTHRDMSRANPNRVRCQLYSMCKHDPSLMRELIRR